MRLSIDRGSVSGIKIDFTSSYRAVSDDSHSVFDVNLGIGNGAARISSAKVFSFVIFYEGIFQV